MKITGITHSPTQTIWVGAAAENGRQYFWLFIEKISALSLSVEDREYAAACRARNPEENWQNRCWTQLRRTEWPAGIEQAVVTAIRGDLMVNNPRRLADRAV